MKMVSAGDNNAQLITRAPPMEENHDGTDERVALWDHIVVCGLPVSVSEFVALLRCTHLNSRRWKHTPVLLIWDGPVSEKTLKDILELEDVYVLRLPPLLNSSLITGRVDEAKRVVLLRCEEQRSLDEKQEADTGAFSSVMQDSAVIFAYNYICENMAHMVQHTICEVVHKDSLAFLETQASAPRYDKNDL
jgi:hypothetical protein